jgi:hypothetical protein
MLSAVVTFIHLLEPLCVAEPVLMHPAAERKKRKKKRTHQYAHIQPPASPSGNELLLAWTGFF